LFLENVVVETLHQTSASVLPASQYSSIVECGTVDACLVLSNTHGTLVPTTLHFSDCWTAQPDGVHLNSHC